MRSYSIVTEFDLVCENEYLVELQTSILFVGYVFGAATLSWFVDNYGRKRVLFMSIGIVMATGLVSVFVGNIYAFIACRFVTGFFLHGTFPQLNVMISEIVGNKYRAFANNITFFAVACAFCVLALKAYLINVYLDNNWKLLFVVCTAPYTFVLLFAFFVPESVRYYRVKGELDEAMAVFQRIARWNNVDLPDDISITPAPSNENRKANPLDLFRTRKMARASCVFGWSVLTLNMAYYGLYYIAGDISGRLYSDFVLITILDIPASLLLTPLLDRYGRRKCSMLFLLAASLCCIGLGFVPMEGDLKVLRIALGMIGKTSLSMSNMSQITWSLESFPTSIRGEASGLFQFLNKIGAAGSVWINRVLLDVYPGAVFLLYGGINFVSMCLQVVLPETNGKILADTEQDDVQADDQLGEEK